MILVVPLVWMALLAQGPATVPLSGTVVGPGGRAVAGAEMILAGVALNDPPILARGRSDAEGRFMLDRPAGLAGQGRSNAPSLWVVKPGFHLSVTRFPGPLPEAGEPVRVALKPPGKAEVRVEGPNGEPLAGVQVRVTSFAGDLTNGPGVVVDLVKATTNKDGLAVIDAVANDEVREFRVSSERFGTQGRSFFPTSPKPKRVWLRPASSFRGRLMGDAPNLGKGWHVTASTYASSPDAETIGYATATSGDDGRFSFPMIAPGRLQLAFKHPRDLPVLPDLRQLLAVTEGRENSLEIPLRPAATIAGVVQERGTGTPIPGVRLVLDPTGVTRTEFSARFVIAETNAQGRYAFRTLVHKGQVAVAVTPPSHIRTGETVPKEFTIPDGTGRLGLDPFEIVLAAPPLRFVVRDEVGKPVAHARIRGQSPSGPLGMVSEIADDRGEFSLGGLTPGNEVTIEAHHGQKSTDTPVKAVAGGINPVIVTIVPGLTFAARGRVLSPDGMPVSAVVVTVQLATERKLGNYELPETFRFDDGVEVRTGVDGSFLTPKELYGKSRRFRASVIADRFVTHQTDWVSSPGGDLIAFPDLTLRRVWTPRSISGRVVDRDGKGIAGISVFQSGDTPRRAGTMTVADGYFRLTGVPNVDAFVFAEKDGFRFGAASLAPGDERVEIRCTTLERGSPP